jgi:hypothetical protein
MDKVELLAYFVDRGHDSLTVGSLGDKELRRLGLMQMLSAMELIGSGVIDASADLTALSAKLTRTYNLQNTSLLVKGGDLRALYLAVFAS